ncbi:MAG TPA: ABC transporter ATP-binding protein [Leeuwenhoekiella sp.]|nr:ABC transporter ATP-binding protein [Leeuwenhoekiella sp.]HAX15801.1 ABC transporter ATP-binding protein [Leeuwenhoekiella sp.]HBO28511.1 ABC transporter ATP-binding protein [Leeuwenhoekiella sp.]HCQ77997.1 ABC transporter ATP-binding protein [Leeuwenhoekiella sp.]|tara:strand:+ start:5447 stop:6715 length:1269 start_codon:yes stop_codon:yes gene_type:complete
MSDIILKAENISKQYRLGTVGTGTLRDDLKRNWARLLGKEDPFLKVGAVNDRSKQSTEDYVWALRDINFEVKQGEVLGIIGKNGAGKSTLLKILSRVTAPSTGVIKSRGRIASLLEVGTGFHHELTGRENIYLNGAILGMQKAEITRKLDEIIAFSGCERYIDTPTKRYSSGMTVRLAFAVAAHLEPEILVVDEVLAVGDAEFQKKAIGKMQDISQGEGRTVLFVSHNMNSIAQLTNRLLIMKNGGITYSGDPLVGISNYLNEEKLSNTIKYDESRGKPYIESVSVNTILDHNIHLFGKELSFEFLLICPNDTEDLAMSFQILNEQEIPITHNWIFDADKNRLRKSGKYHFTCSMPKPKLYMGNYSLKIFLSNSKTKEKYQVIEGIGDFKVEMLTTTRTDYNWQKGACVYLEEASWEINKYD